MVKISVYVCVKNDALLTFIRTYLDGAKNIDLHIEQSGSALLTSLSLNDTPELLILDENRANALDLDEFNDIPNKIVFSASGDTTYANWSHYSADRWKEAIDKFIEGVGNIEADTYAKFPFKILKSVEIPVCDIYLEIKRDGSPHHIKLFKMNEPINQDQVENYLDKGVVTGKIDKDAKMQFLNSISNMLYMKMKDGFAPDIVGNSLDTAVSILKDVGFNSTSTQLLDGVVESINTTLSSNKTKNVKVITDLLNSQSSRFYKKAHITSMLGIQVLAQEEWASHKHQELMTYLSLMCDVTLTKPEMLFIRDKKQLDDSSLSQEDKQIVWSHARDAFELMQNYKECPIETDLLVLEHHGNKNGIGFPNVIQTNVSKITLIFRICEDFTIEVLKNKELGAGIKLNDIFADIYKMHNKKVLHAYIDKLKKCFF